MPRTAGLRGRLPKLSVSDRLQLGYLHEYARDPLPAPVYPVDVTEGITDWKMLGNGPDPTCSSHPDGVGDCTFVGREHYKMAKAARAEKTEAWETSDELVAEYLAYNNGQDQGANIAQLLLSWYQSGKIVAFAPVDHSDPAMVDSAMSLFTGVYCVAPSTGVLTADLRWEAAGAIIEGEALIGFDEQPSSESPSARRKWRRSVVTRAQRVIKHCYHLTFSDGTKVRCSADHQWLRAGKASYGRDRVYWIRTDEMRVGSTRGTSSAQTHGHLGNRPILCGWVSRSSLRRGRAPPAAV